MYLSCRLDDFEKLDSLNEPITEEHSHSSSTVSAASSYNMFYYHHSPRSEDV